MFLLQNHWAAEFQPNFKVLYVLVIFHRNYKGQINSNVELSDFLSMTTLHFYSSLIIIVPTCGELDTFVRFEEIFLQQILHFN